MQRTSLILPNRGDTYKGYLECRKCHNDKLQVKLVGPTGNDEFTHVDFYCPICGDFVLHFNITPHIRKADEWMTQINNDPRIMVNEGDELSSIGLDEDLLEE